MFLSQRYKTFYITSKTSAIPDEIQKHVALYRLPLHLGFLKGDVYFMAHYLLFTVFALCVAAWLRLSRRVNVVYTTYTPDSVAGFFLKMLRVKWVVDIMDLLVMYATDRQVLRKEINPNFPWVRRVVVKAVKGAIRHADLVLVPGVAKESGLPKVIIDGYRVRPDRGLPVRNGIDLERTTPSGEHRRDGKFTVVYVGNVTPRRGVDILVEACALALRHVPELELVLGGPAMEEDQRWLREALDERRILNGHVSYVGPLEHSKALALMESGDVCVYPFPPKIELDGVLPVKVFEYLALGKPVVATRLEGVSRIIRDGQNGLLVAPEDPQQMSDALVRLYRDPELRRTLVRNARPSVVQYDWKTIFSALGPALDQLDGPKDMRRSKCLATNKK